METAIIVPAYNENNEILEVINKIAKYTDKSNIVIIDDGSKDCTYVVSKTSDCVVLRHPINLGKGGAMKTGTEYAIKHGAKKIIFIDSDGQHDPKHIPEIEAALDNNEIVFTYRTFNKQMPGILRLGNSLIKKAGTFFYKKDIKDPLCGYRGIRSEIYPLIKWQAPGYEVESEVIFNTRYSKMRYTELPIETIYKDGYKGTGVMDGIKIVLNLVWWWITQHGKPIPKP